jgi:hypothetical protein
VTLRSLGLRADFAFAAIPVHASTLPGTPNRISIARA